MAGVSVHSIRFRIRKGDLQRYRERRNINNAVYVDKDEVLKIYGAGEFVTDKEKK